VYVYQTGPLTQAVPLFILRRLYRCRTVIWTQDVWPDTVFAYGFSPHGLGARVLRSFVRHVYRQCDVIHVSSPGFASALQPNLRRGTVVECVPQWAPAELTTGLHAAPVVLYKGDRVNFLFAGNLGRMQNLDALVRAFDIAARAGARIQLHLVGDGSHAPVLRSLCRELGTTAVEFWGRRGLGETMQWLRACDFTVLSLTPDPLVSLTVPAKFQAYLAAGRPLLVAARGEVARLAAAEGIGVVCDPQSPSTIAEAILACCRMDERARAAMADRVTTLSTTRYDRHSLLSRISRVVFDESR
jgi:glycosyltransferase involved in cell wall biosynthesis